MKRMITKWGLLAGCICILSNITEAAIEVIYVSPKGNDTWSGKFKSPKGNNQDGPLLSVTAALERARTLKNSGLETTLVLRGGDYSLSEPLSLPPELSGLTISAYKEESPILRGDSPISGWSRVVGRTNFWQTQIPATSEGKWYFHELFVNGQRKIRARSESYFRIRGASSEASPTKLPVHPGDMDPQWAKTGDVELVALFAWSSFRLFVREVDQTNNTVTLSDSSRGCSLEPDARYYVENSLDLVDQPGEWYLDRRSGLLTYYAAESENPNTEKITAPRLQNLMVLNGNAQQPIHNVLIKGLSFRGTDWTTSSTGYLESQAAVEVSATLQAKWATGCVIEDCNFSELGGWAIDLGRGCQDDKIIGSDLYDLGGGGIRVGETGIANTKVDANKHHVLTDNHIHHLGLVYPSAVGVLILQSGENRVAHNEINNLFYTAVSVGWTWGYKESPCRQNMIEFNHLHHIGQGLLSDMGAVYTLGPQSGTVVRNNLIHDVTAFKYGGWGLYTDEGSTGIVLENNIVYRCKSAGFHQHYGRENVLRNNIFASNPEYTIMRTRPEEHLSFSFTNNILYKSSGGFFGGNWSCEHFAVDRNLLFDTKIRPAEVAKTIEDWRARGHDVDSLIADPFFINPAKDDFRLQAGSPAFRLGFKPIDMRNVGVRKKSRSLQVRPE